MITIIFYLLQICFGILFLFLTIAFITGAPFVPSQRKTVKRMIELANIQPNDIICDLGSGDGRLLLEAAELTKEQVTGIEINPYLVLLTQLKLLFRNTNKKISCVWGDFWHTNLSNTDVVFVYLLPWKMEALAKKLKKELRPGSRVVSNSFVFPNWKMANKDESLHIYVFEV